MRKPAVVVTLILALTLSITLARHLAQPAITNERPTESPKVLAVAEATVVPAAALAMPVRPTIARHSRASTTSSRASTTSSRAKRGILSSSKASSETPSTPSYNAMLGSPDAAFRAVKDHGTHGIGTPQWIDSLSGAKGRVPVRDFAGEDTQKGQTFSEPLTVTVDSLGDSEVDSAH
jgi:hypothetical protein